MESETQCAICTLHIQLQAQIEAKYIQGELSAVQMVAQLGAEHIDLMGVLVHFQDHETAVEKEAESKARDRRLRDARRVVDTPVKEEDVEEEGEDDFKVMRVPAKARRAAVGSRRVEDLEKMLEILQSKFKEIMITKQLSGISALAREIRETMREIDKVRKEERATLADRTEDLFTEHRSMNRFLLHNLCPDCMAKYEGWLKGTEVDVHS